MKKLKIKKAILRIISFCLVFVCLTLVACVKTETYRGIIVNVECKKSTFCNFDDGQRYIDVTFEITIENDYYVGKDLTFVALTKDETELYRQICVFDETKIIEVSFKEYSEAFKWMEGIMNTTLQTQKIVLYEGSTVVGSAEIKEINVVVQKI